MRKLLTGAVSSLACAILIAGSAQAAAGMTSAEHSPQMAGNRALQDQLERDTRLSNAWLRESPAGQVVVPGTASQSSDRVVMNISEGGQPDDGARRHAVHSARRAHSFLARELTRGHTDHPET